MIDRLFHRDKQISAGAGLPGGLNTTN